MCLGLSFTLYHGKSPVNHHWGEYFGTFSKHLKQINENVLILTMVVTIGYWVDYIHCIILQVLENWILIIKVGYGIFNKSLQ